MPEIQDFHAHVYYDESTIEQARQLCETAGQQFELTVGRMHEKLVGPHPCWSCQLAFGPEHFGTVIPWLALNRDGLVIFIHPSTGDDLQDHTKYTIWMGEMMTLNLSTFK